MSASAAASDLYPTDRLERARSAAADAGFDALLLTPGADLRYLTGYSALPLERLTCLVLPTQGDPLLVVPVLERPMALAAPTVGAGLAVAGWHETDDPYRLVADHLATALGHPVGKLGVADRMWAEQAFAFREVLSPGELTTAGAVLRQLRIRKSPAEVEALRRAGAAIDRVHDRIHEWLTVGRTEAEVGRDIAEAILTEGHSTVDFTIVGSGPNGASPHHHVSDRVIEAGDVVVVDIGGTTEEGYCSDSTRTYVVGGQPNPAVAEYYDVLMKAQEVGVQAVRPGVPAREVDAITRAVIEEAGYGEYFVHRTGHGIGLEGHEEPYIVDGNDLPLEPGMALSVEPGIYLPGLHGARIEDIVVVTEDGVERLNNTRRDLVVLES